MAPASNSGASSDDHDAFPYQQLGVLAFVRLAEPIAFVSIVSYSFPMVKEIKGEDNASFFAGLLVSAFAMAEACTAMLWGYLSDRYGRKPMILVALGGTALSSLLFGFAKNYWVALAARVVGGLLNGNVAVMQTMIAEMITNPAHEPRAYALQPFMWSVGSIAGSALGGFTAQPARFYPGLFSQNGLFGKFPYLLPNLIAVVIIVIAMIQAYFLLKETNPALTSQIPQVRISSNAAIDETTPLRAEEEEDVATSKRQRRPSDAILIANSMPIPNDPNLDLRRTSFGSVGSLRVISKVISAREAQFGDAESASSVSDNVPIKAFNKEVIAWTIALLLMCYHQMAFASILPIYLQDYPHKTPGHLDLVGGLGLSLHDVGVYLAINSLLCLFLQGFIFPVFVAKIGVWHSVASLTIFAPFVHLAVPFVSLLPNAKIGIFIMMMLQSFICIIVYPCLLILLKNATESPLVLGKVNGLAMSLCSGARTISPPLVGIFYSTTGSAGAWWSCAAVGIMAAIELFFTPRTRDGNERILKRAAAVVEDD